MTDQAFTIPLEDRPAPLKARVLPIAILALYFLINFLVVAPWGNFPLNDDWMYSLSVRTLLETGRLKMLGGCPNCALHIILGALACITGGVSHDTLRVFNLFISMAGVFALYGTLLEIKIKRAVACLASFVYASSPLFTNMSYTYMTDLSSVSFMTLYLYFMVRSIGRRSIIALAGASIMLMCAIAIRQTNTLFVGCNLALLLLIRLRKGSVMPLLLWLVIAPTAWAFFLDHLMELMNEFPAAYNWYKIELMNMAINTLKHPFPGLLALFGHTGKTLSYLSLFIAPLLVPCLPPILGQLRKRSKATLIMLCAPALAIAAAAIKLIWQERRIMPFSENLLHLPELGAITIIGHAFAHPHRRLRNWLTVFSFAMAFLLGTVIVAGIQRAVMLALKYAKHGRHNDDIDYPARRLLIVAFAFASLTISFAWVVLHTMICDLDRYYLMPLVPLIICTAITWRWLSVKPMWLISVPIALAIAVYSTCAEQDYISWNRARWAALNDLEKSGITSEKIDGGTEYNYSRDPALNGDVELRPGKFNWIHKGAFPRSSWRSWSLHGELYIISFVPLQDYKVVARYPYFDALSFKYREILVLKHIVKQPLPVI